MNIRFLLLPLLVFISIFYSIYGCVYLEDHDNCDYTTNQGLNIITINTQNIGEYEIIEASIQTPQGYTIPLEILDVNEENEQISFSQSRIFESFGVYEITVEATLRDSISTIEREFSLLYDNSNPLPPVIEEVTQLSQSGEPLKITGFVNNPGIDEEVIIYNDGEEVDRVMVTNEAFESIFNIDEVNKISLQTRRKNGELSAMYSFMYYSDDIDFENAQPARVTNVDFESTNELIKSSPSTIYSYSPYYHISGRASNGDMVFIQGVPIPVINGNFESFLLLNEGENDVCVRGTNSVCDSITTIYSYEASEFNLDLSNINSINIDSLQSDEFVEQLNAQGKFTNSYSQADLISTPVNRNIFFLEFFYPGVYEKKYMLVDREDPEIEIMASNTLYPSSTIGVYLNDDIGINLESLRVNIGSTEYTIDDIINDESLGRIQYLEFPTPTISSNNEDIVVSVEDTDGKTSQKSKSAEFKGRLESNLQVEFMNNEKIGNHIFKSTDDSPVQLKIFNPLTNSDSNSPIAIKSSEIDKQFISLYSINENNEIILTIDDDMIAQNSRLDISLLVYNSIGTNSYTQFDMNFNITKIKRTLENREEFRIVEKYVDDDLTIIELKNPYIDYSSLRVNGRADNFFIKGDYLFVSSDYSSDIVISYEDINNNFRSFSTGFDNSQITLDSGSSSNSRYLTYTLNSAKNINYVDLLSSTRTKELEVIKSNSQTYINPSFIEGTSVQEQSLFSSNYATSKFDTLIQEQFSFSNYPTIEVEDKIQYRGLKTFTTANSMVVQGRILGSDPIDSVSIGDVGCSVKERFFVCKNIDTSEYYNVHVVSVNGEPLGDIETGSGDVIVDSDGDVLDSDGNVVVDSDGNIVNGNEDSEGNILDSDGNVVVDSEGNILDSDGNVRVDSDGNVLDSDGNIIVDSDGNIVNGNEDSEGNILDSDGNVAVDSDGNVLDSNGSQSGNNGGDGVIEVVNPSQGEKSRLELDLDANENVFLSSEGYTFSSGDIVFDFTPVTNGEHELYINGELIKRFNVAGQNTNSLVIELLEEEYLNRDTVGSDLNVYVEDEDNQESNSLSMRFTRILNAIINIVVS